MSKFRYSLNGGTSWTVIDAALPYNIAGAAASDTVMVEPIGAAVTNAGQALNVANVWKGDGQSNMEGTDATPPPGWVNTAMIQVFNGATYQMYEPGVCTGRTVDSGGAVINKTNVGPEAGFAMSELAANPTKTVYLQIFAKGSTSLALDWSKTSPGGMALYAKATTYFQAADAALVAAGKTISVGGWMRAQGEADASIQSYGENYGTNLTAFIVSARTDWGIPANVPLAMLRIVTIARPYGKHVRDWLAKVALDDPNVFLFNADDIPNDGTHFTSGTGYALIGQRIRQVFQGTYADYASSVPATPTITTNGALSIAENSTALGALTTNAEIVAFSIQGGVDAAKFQVDPASGALSFIAAPDYETPTDTGANNVYDIVVGARNGRGNTGTKAIAVQVTDVNETVQDGEAQTVAYMNRSTALGATTTTTGNAAFRAAIKKALAALVNNNLISRMPVTHIARVVGEGAAFQVNFTNPGTYDLLTFNGTGTTKGTLVARDGYTPNGVNSQSDNVSGTFNPSTYFGDLAARAGMGLWRWDSVGDAGSGMNIGNATGVGLLLRRNRAVLGSSNANPTGSSDTTGFFAAWKPGSNTQIKVADADGVVFQSLTVTDAAVTSTTFAAPGTGTGRVAAYGVVSGTWSEAEADLLGSIMDTLMAEIAAS